MENKLIVTGLEEYEDITKKQHQEDFIDLDAVCYYSNIPLSELCSSGTLKLKEKDEESFRLKNIGKIKVRLPKKLINR